MSEIIVSREMGGADRSHTDLLWHRARVSCHLTGIKAHFFSAAVCSKPAEAQRKNTDSKPQRWSHESPPHPLWAERNTLSWGEVRGGGHGHGHPPGDRPSEPGAVCCVLLTFACARLSGTAGDDSEDGSRLCP